MGRACLPISVKRITINDGLKYYFSELEFLTFSLLLSLLLLILRGSLTLLQRIRDILCGFVGLSLTVNCILGLTFCRYSDYFFFLSDICIP